MGYKICASNHRLAELFAGLIRYSVLLRLFFILLYFILPYLFHVFPLCTFFKKKKVLTIEQLEGPTCTSVECKNGKTNVPYAHSLGLCVFSNTCVFPRCCVFCLEIHCGLYKSQMKSNTSYFIVVTVSVYQCT